MLVFIIVFGTLYEQSYFVWKHLFLVQLSFVALVLYFYKGANMVSETGV